MCLSPITIPNQTKYVSLRFRDRFLQQVPCGVCSECQQLNSNQWYFRTYYEWLDVQKAGGYVLFDTLTYSDKYLPHLSDTWNFLSKSEDFPCFDYLHIRNFLQNLRIRLIRAGFLKNSFRYFLSSEYGSHDYYKVNGVVRRATHRPHYHLLLFVYDNRIQPLYLSRLISELWKFGRTDGVPYHSYRYVMDKNVILSSSVLASKLRVCRYVTKYVQKSCKFQHELDKRITKVLFRMADYVCTDNSNFTVDEWLESENCHREKLKLLRYVNQFHRQSQHFGESALEDIDLNQLYKDGCLFMPDSKHVKIAVSLSTYYKRKLFYELVEFNGRRYWQLNDEGLNYFRFRESFNFDRLFSRYDCVNAQYHLGLDVASLVDYVLNWRGTIIADLPSSRLQDRFDCIDLFNYSTCSDKLHFGCRGLSPFFLGESQLGYISDKIVSRISLSDFITRFCYFDQDLEKQLSILYSYMHDKSVKAQAAFELRQHMEQVIKFFSC